MDYITSALLTAQNTGIIPAPSQPAQQQPAQGSRPDTTDQSGFGQDQVSLSTAGQQLSRQQGEQVGQQPAAESASQEETPEKNRQGETNLNQTEQQEVRDLKNRDREVRAHEAAHLAAAGQYASGGASYTYQQGPDGKRYAVGGEVPINVGKERTPEETIQKMQIVRRAALAPANPSGADRQIAAKASQNEAQARQEIQRERQQGSDAQFSTSTQPDGPTGQGTPGASEGDHTNTGMIDLAA